MNQDIITCFDLERIQITCGECNDGSIGITEFLNHSKNHKPKNYSTRHRE